MSLPLAERLIASLPPEQPGMFNPWRQTCAHDLPHNTVEAKLSRLAAHLACDPLLILVGEAPGYQGCRYSGIAFTSERLLIEGAIPRIASCQARLTNRHLPFSEPSATIVWKTLFRLGVAERTILWNAVQLHPYRAGECWSNRTPTPDELALGAPALNLLHSAFPGALVVAVGLNAAASLQRLEIPPAATVRHPANGGATRFARDIESLVLSLSG